MIEFISENFNTYYNTQENRREGHTPRIILFVVMALLVRTFADSISSDVNNMMLTGLTILTGFTFTALFSDHSLADVGLPKARNETDRYDLKRLDQLAKNFHTRSKYFIILSTLNVCILIVKSIDFHIPRTIDPYFRIITEYLGINIYSGYFELTLTVSIYIIDFLSIFLFMECLYTFYRLAETIISIVNTRREYMKASTDQ